VRERERERERERILSQYCGRGLDGRLAGKTRAVVRERERERENLQQELARQWRREKL